MKKLAGIHLFFLFFSLSAHGQLISSLPIAANGNLTVNKVVQVDGTERAELYLRANQFYSMIHKSANGSVTADNKGLGMVCKGVSDVWIMHESYLRKEQLCYTLKIQCKDGRYKYEIYDFYFKNKRGQLPIKTILDQSTHSENDRSTKAFYKAYKAEFDTTVKNLTALLESTMLTQFASN